MVYDHLQAAFIGDSPNLDEGEPVSDHSFIIDNLRLNQEEDEYLKAVSRIKSYIEAGDTYQVNYTLKLLFGFSGSVTDFYCSLRRNQSVSYGALIRNDDLTVLSLSPELFLLAAALWPAVLWPVVP